MTAETKKEIASLRAAAYPWLECVSDEQILLGLSGERLANALDQFRVSAAQLAESFAKLGEAARRLK